LIIIHRSNVINQWDKLYYYTRKSCLNVLKISRGNNGVSAAELQYWRGRAKKSPGKNRDRYLLLFEQEKLTSS